MVMLNTTRAFTLFVAVLTLSFASLYGGKTMGKEEGLSRDQENIYLESYGWAFGNQPAVNMMKLTEREAPFVAQGFEDAVMGKDPILDLESASSKVNAFIQKRSKQSDEELSKPLKDEEKDYLTVFGWALGTQPSIRALGLSSEEAKYVNDGFRKSLLKEAPPVDIMEIIEDINAYAIKRAESFKAKCEVELAKEAAKNMELEKPFYDKLAKNEKVKKTDTGLYYEIVKPGSEQHPVADSNVKVDYTGALTNGEVFDSSHKRGEPITFNLQGVIAGWREGLQLVGKGGSIRLYIPPQLAYGNQDIPGIPPGSTLVFDVDLIDIL